MNIVLQRLDRLHTSTYSVVSRSGGSSPLDQFSFIYIPALISGHLFDLGYLRSTLIFASINLVTCSFLIAECHEFWQLLLCQGFGIGVSLQ
jgi:hypothetical protein